MHTILNRLEMPFIIGISDVMWITIYMTSLMPIINPVTSIMPIIFQTQIMTSINVEPTLIGHVIAAAGGKGWREEEECIAGGGVMSFLLL